MLFLNSILSFQIFLISVIIIPSSLSQKVKELPDKQKSQIHMDILTVPGDNNDTVRKEKHISAFACGVNHNKPGPSQFTNCTNFCEEVCDNNLAIEVGGTNYQSCRCTVFNDAVVNAGCCTGSFSDFDIGEKGYTCEDDICGGCFGESICFRIKTNSNGNTDLEQGSGNLVGTVVEVIESHLLSSTIRNQPLAFLIAVTTMLAFSFEM